MPSPPEFLPARPWSGSSQHVATEEPQVGGAACRPPSVLPCNAVSRHCSLEPAQALQKDRRKQSKLRLLPPRSCPGSWQGAGRQEPQGLASLELTMDSWLGRLGWGQPRVATSHLAASSVHLATDRSSQKSQASHSHACAQAFCLAYQSHPTLSFIL